MINGLFIGINRYRAPITRLSCARADAEALASLFEDNLQGTIVRLLDDLATREAILSSLRNLEQAGPDDLSVIAFSGHGTDDHRIIPSDADGDDLQANCISLDELAQSLDRIPGHLLVVLDCCFSGGFGGARSFAPSAARTATEDRSAVEALAGGGGRVVVTASGAGEYAFETAATGHGIFTHHLLAGLQGSDKLGTDGRVTWLDLLNYVTGQVVEEARRMQEVQTPTIYGSFDGLPTLPILTPGESFARAFPDRVRSPVTTNWSTLEQFGFAEVAIESWSRRIPSLNELQLSAINDYGVLEGRSLLISAPTGAGKTLVGELAALRSVSQGARAVMLLPLKALVNDKYDDFLSTYGDNFSVVRATGDHSDQVGDVLSGHYDLALLTYEKFLNLVLSFPHILRGISSVIVDEAQTVSDPNRGASLEFLLALLRSGFARGEPVQIVALSAVIGDTRGFERWLGGGLLRTDIRPVPLRESVLDVSGGLQTLEPDGSESSTTAFIRPELGPGSQSSKPWIIPLVRKLVDDGKKVIVFRAQKGDTVGAARYLADALGLAPARDTLDLLPEGDLSDASVALRHSVAGGVGFHNADLDPLERTALETTFRDPSSNLRVLVATTTLAMGINTPAEAVVIAGLTHPFGEPYSVAEYKNMVGRAGRPGHAEAGESFIVATAEIGPADAWHNYVMSEPEPMTPRFLDEGTDPQTLIVRSLVALGSSVREDELVALLEGSFAVWLQIQQGTSGWDIHALHRDLDLLVAAGLLDREPSGVLTLTELGRFAGQSGIEVQSVANVGSVLRFAPQHLSTADLATIAQVTVELDQQWIPSNTKSNQERFKWPNRLEAVGANRSLIQNLHVGGGDSFMRTKRALATMLFASEQPMSEIESELLKHYFGTSAAGPIRAVSNRTRDVLDPVCRIAQIAGHSTDEDATDGALGVRFEIGLPAALAPLALKLGTLLTRAQYLDLFKAGLTDRGTIAQRTDEVSNFLGGDVTRQVLQRLGVTS